VAEVGAFLASDRASFVTGGVIPVDGPGRPSWRDVVSTLQTAGDHRVSRVAGVAGTRRQYDSPLRRQRAAETRARILAAGSELLHGSSVRDWHGLTIRAVAEKAGVNERTVYRHFTNEQGLRDAVMHEFEHEEGIDLRGMQLEDVADVTARIFAHVSSYPSDARQPLDPTLLDAKQRQHDALLAAVVARAERWSEADRALAAAVLDVLWSVASYERMVVDWQIDPAEATRAISWVIGLINRAIAAGPAGLT
jgi:AcrR family transcriptional regulator